MLLLIIGKIVNERLHVMKKLLVSLLLLFSAHGLLVGAEQEVVQSEDSKQELEKFFHVLPYQAENPIQVKKSVFNSLKSLSSIAEIIENNDDDSSDASQNIPLHQGTTDECQQLFSFLNQLSFDQSKDKPEILKGSLQTALNKFIETKKMPEKIKTVWQLAKMANYLDVQVPVGIQEGGVLRAYNQPMSICAIELLNNLFLSASSTPIRTIKEISNFIGKDLLNTQVDLTRSLNNHAYKNLGNSFLQYHSMIVNQYEYVQLIQDKSRLVTRHNNKIKIIDRETEEVVCTIQKPIFYVRKILYSKDGTFFVAYAYNSLLIGCPKTGQEKFFLNVGNSIEHLFLSDDDKSIVLTFSDHVDILDTQTGEQKFHADFSDESSFKKAFLSKNNKWVMMRSLNAIRVIEQLTGLQKYRIKNGADFTHKFNFFNDLLVTKDEKFLVSSSLDCVLVTDLETGIEKYSVKQSEGGHREQLEQPLLGCDDRFLITHSNDCVLVTHLETGALHKKIMVDPLNDDHKNRILKVKVSCDRKTLITISTDCALVADIETGHQVYKYQSTDPLAFGKTINNALLSSDNRYLVIISDNSVLNVIEVQTNKKYEIKNIINADDMRFDSIGSLFMVTHAIARTSHANPNVTKKRITFYALPNVDQLLEQTNVFDLYRAVIAQNNNCFYPKFNWVLTENGFIEKLALCEEPLSVDQQAESSDGRTVMRPKKAKVTRRLDFQDGDK